MSPSKSSRSADDMNKQEENLLKIFATSSDQSSAISSDLMWQAICFWIMMICNVAACITLCLSMRLSCQDLTQNVPHLDYILSAFTYDFASVVIFNMIASEMNGHQIPNYDRETMFTVFYEWQELFR